MKHEDKAKRPGNSEVPPEQLLTAAERDSQSLFTGAFASLLKNYRASNNQSDSKDAIEKWGSLIGRTLGYLFALVLLINLFTGWFF